MTASQTCDFIFSHNMTLLSHASPPYECRYTDDSNIYCMSVAAVKGRPDFVNDSEKDKCHKAESSMIVAHVQKCEEQ